MAPESIAPALLVAMPQLLDPNFHRSVVLLVEHSPEGALGLVLNRPGSLSVADLCSSLGIPWSGDPHASTDWGGPVNPNMGWMLFSSPLDGQSSEEPLALYGTEDPEDDDEPDARKLMDGVYFGMTLDTLRGMVARRPDGFRLFLGYAGWGPGQLEEELARGDWILAPAQADRVFASASEDLWTRVIHALGVDPTHLISTPGVH